MIDSLYSIIQTYGQIFIGLCFFVSANGQTSITSSDFLKTAQQSLNLALQDRQLDFLENTNHETPMTDEVEFRTETDEMDWERQEYLLRYRFNGQKERKEQNTLHQKNIRIEELEKTLILENELMIRYETVLKYIHLKNKIGLRKQQQLVATDRINVLQRMAANSTDFNINEFIDTEEELHKLEQQLLEMENGEKQLDLSIQSTMGRSQPIDLDTSDFISIYQLQSIVAEVFTSIQTNPRLSQRQARIDQSFSEYSLEEAKERQIVDYIQMKYSQRKNLDYHQEWSFGIGLNLPVKASNRIQFNELILERMEQENRLQTLKQNLTEDLQTALREFDSKFEKLELIKRQIKASQALFSFDSYPRYSDANPLTLLQIKASLLKKEETILDVKKDIYSLYLELLKLTGKVVEMPLKNYLSESLDLLEK